MDDITQARIATLIPELGRRLTNLDTMLLAGNPVVHFRCTRAKATYAEQAAIYAKGRTEYGEPCEHDGVKRPLGSCPEHPMGLVVTNAGPLDSMHVYGLAGDGCPDLPDLPSWQPDWNTRDARWNEFLTMATQCGLAEGAQWRTFKDFPHLYLKEMGPNPDDNLKALLNDGGVPAVWNWVNKEYGFAN